MNPMTNIKNIQKLNALELERGLAGSTSSWHAQYKDSAWVFVGGLPYDLTEGDVICIFSQYGEIVNFNLVRDNKTGKSKGFCFICYEDQRSTILAVDNLNSAKVLGRMLRVDHVENYKPPKDHGDEDEVTQKLRLEGCAPKVESSSEAEEEEQLGQPMKKAKKEKKKKAKKEKKLKKEKKKKKKKQESSSDSSDSEEDNSAALKLKVKKEKHDPDYYKHAIKSEPMEDIKAGIRPESIERKRHRSPTGRHDETRGRGRSPDRSRDRRRDRSPDVSFKRERDLSPDQDSRRDRDRSRIEDREEGRGGGRRDRDSRMERTRQVDSREEFDRSRERDSRRERDRSRERDSRRERERSRERDSRRERDYRR